MRVAEETKRADCWCYLDQGIQAIRVDVKKLANYTVGNQLEEISTLSLGRD